MSEMEKRSNSMPGEKIIAVCFPKFFKAMRSFFIEAVDAARADSVSEPVLPVANFYEITFNEQAGVSRGASLTIVQKHDPQARLLRIWQKLTETATYHSVLEELKEIERSVHAVGHQSSDIGQSYLFPILERYISSSLLFEEEGFEEAYSDLENYLSNSSAAVRIFMKLWFLQGEETLVPLSATHRIIKVDTERAKQLWSVSVRADRPVPAFPTLLQPHPLLIYVYPGDFVLEATIRFPKEESNRLSELLRRETESAALALRLCEPGSGQIEFITYEHVGFSPSFGRYGISRPPQYGHFSYKLDSRIAENIKKVWPISYSLASEMQIKPEAVTRSVRIATRRFSSSFDKTAAEDRLIDYFFALEALYSKEDEAISYRLPLRVATLIGKSPEERNAIFDLLRGGYTQRSNLAHGKGELGHSVKIKGKNIPTTELLLDIQRYLLRSILSFLSAGKRSRDKEDVLRVVDAAIITQDRAMLERELQISDTFSPTKGEVPAPQARKDDSPPS